MFDSRQSSLGIIGLGYVGLPLAVEFSKHFPTVGYDIDKQRVEKLKNGTDDTLEVDSDELRETKLQFTDSLDDIRDCNVYVVTVPTPINKHKWPDLRPLESASRTVGKVLGKGDVVIFESTVYPGATEEVCVPIIESYSNLKFNQDFFVGYSPERINPGDKIHKVSSIVKITSGSTPETADYVDSLYSRIIQAGTYKASSLKVAEAAKVIENTQRDVNIALVNELAMIFNRIGIDTEEVLAAAGSKWNFLPFRPGLVGGHCIGVDPYYLTHKALETGYQPTIIPASRLLNDGMGEHVATRVIELMASRHISVVGGRILLMGFTFKENCPDLRNTRCLDILQAFRRFNAEVDVYDPWVDAQRAEHEYGISPIRTLVENSYDAIVVTVGHQQFHELGSTYLRTLGKDPHVLFDVKYLFRAEETDGRL